MTATSLSNSVSDSRLTLPGKLIDLLIEAVVLPTDALGRSALLCDLLNELCEAVDWIHSSATLPDDSTSEESASLRQLAAAAQDHQLRMTALGADASGRRF